MDSTKISAVSNQMIGKTMSEAKQIYEKIRVIKEDGIPCFITFEVRSDRINVEVNQGKIIRIDGFY